MVSTDFFKITSIERFGMRSTADITPDTLAYVKAAGYNAVFVNGGSGFGADSIPIECLVQTQAIPDLMPRSHEIYRREIKRRIELLSKFEITPFLCVWAAACGPSQNSDSMSHFFDRRIKLEMQAKFRRTPEIFGYGGHWRGNRPLCTSHPVVMDFYRELYSKILIEYPEIKGILFFPGDSRLEICSSECPRCAATGLAQQERMIRFVNEAYKALAEVDNEFKFYYTFWNIEQPGVKTGLTRESITRCLKELNPKISLAMSICDNTTQTRKSGQITISQPWGTCVTPGNLFKQIVEEAAVTGRSIMVISEISQSEQFDPVCLNMPFALKTLSLFRNIEGIKNVNALLDFWGNKTPLIPDACHSVMKSYCISPVLSDEDILKNAIIDHYGTLASETKLIECALSAWRSFDRLCDCYALTGWSQRFSFATGRNGGRGKLFLPLIPQNLRDKSSFWAVKWILQNGITPQKFYLYHKNDLKEFEKSAEAFSQLAAMLKEKSLIRGSKIAEREADAIRLAGHLNLSIGHYIYAVSLYENSDFSQLKKIISDEIENREYELAISGRLAPFSGIDIILCEEDIQNMIFYISDDEYPIVPDNLFSFSNVMMDA